MGKLVWCVIGAVVGTTGLAAAQDRHEIGGLSFGLPTAWKYEEPPAGSDHVRLTYLDQKRYCIVSLYTPRATTAKLPAEFLGEWKALAGSISGDTPKTSTRKLGGRAVMEASGMITAPDGTRALERVSVIEDKTQLSTMIVFTATAATGRACQSDSDKIAASLQFPAAAPAAPAPAAPAPAAPAPAASNGLAGTLKASITLADLAGTWFKGAGVVTYHDTSNGGVPGTSASVVGMSYVFTAAGTYLYEERGRYGNQSFHNTEKGKVALDGGNVVLTSTTGRVQRFQLIAFMTLADGAAVITLNNIGTDGQPMTSDQIASSCGPKDGVFQCRYSDPWSRQAKSR